MVEILPFLMTNRTRVITVWTALVFSATALSAQQQSASIRGLVTGPDGQVFAGATVTLLDQLGSRIAATSTEQTGRFLFEQVAPGTYTLFAEAPSGVADAAAAPGVSPQRSDARIVTVQGALPIEVALTLAPHIAETVVVEGTAEAPPVTTRTTIAGDALRQMPTRLPSRGVQQLLATLPGWASEDNGVLHVRGVDDGVLYVEDGVPVYDRVDTTFGIAPDPAGIGTMNVLTGYIPPEYGLKAGAVIEVQSSTAERTGWTAILDAGIGGDGLRSGRTLAGGPIGGRATLGVSVASERSDRFLDPVHPENFHNEGGVLSGEAHMTLLGSDNDLVRINVAAGRSRYDVPHGGEQEEAGQDQRQRLLQDSESGSWQRVWSSTTASQFAMYRRRVDADLLSSVNDTPLSASSDRQQERLGVLASLTHQRSRHTFKVGLEAARLKLHEDFSFAVTDHEEAKEAEISERAAEFTLADPFRFEGRASRMQWSFYAQDRLRASDRLSLDFGVRFDRSHLLIPASQWSPRVGMAYSWPGSGTTARASLNRFYQPPQPEHLLLSSSPAARALSPFADSGGEEGEEAGGAALEPERQTAWEIGLEQRLAGTFRFDIAYWSRHVRNYTDPNVFFGTTIVFPNSVASGRARGVDLRLEMPRYRGWSAYLSYTNSSVVQVGPVNGGLFLEENIIDIGPGTRFTPDHDQRHVSAAGVTYQRPARGFSASLAVGHQSGTPLEVEDPADLLERPGAELVDFDRGRVRPRTVFDLTLSQVLQRGDHTETSVRLSVLNFTNHAYAMNFGNPFSGTHFGAPRTIRAEVRIGLR
jgi:outer membrane receptor protein involved in Fe transport